MWALRRHVPKDVFCGFAVASKKMVSKMCSAQRLRRRRVLGTCVLEHVFQTCPVARTRLSDAPRGQKSSFTCVAWPEHVFQMCRMARTRLSSASVYPEHIFQAWAYAENTSSRRQNTSLERLPRRRTHFIWWNTSLRRGRSHPQHVF